MGAKAKILIVDDEPLILKSLSLVFQDDYDVVTADSGNEALKIISNASDLGCIILDIKMEDMDGLETAEQINSINSEIPIIFHTGFPGEYSEDNIDRDHRPFDYVTKNEKPVRLYRAVRNAVNYYRSRLPGSSLIEKAKNVYGMIGKSAAMLDVYRRIEEIAQTENKVLILGPTGSGKELVARAVHGQSKRADQKFAILNCNHKQADLIESELFGHLKGAFTGAIADRIGKFEYADKGTLFLDEIGDLDITTQAKLLRVSEYGEMEKLGSPKTFTVDVRIICATHRDLEEMIKEDKFREDLFYRLKESVIRLPALKERREDIPELMENFVDEYIQKNDCHIKLIDNSGRDLLIEYDWPGNVRQLRAVLFSLLANSVSTVITSDDIKKELDFSENVESQSNILRDKLQEYERTLIIQALARNSNNVSAAARQLGLDPGNLSKKIKSLNINK